MTDNDAGDNALSGLDLHAWRVPPPAAVDRSALLVRALSPAAAPAKRVRIAWIFAAIVLVNAAIATVIVILLARPPAASRTVTVQPAGGSVDARVNDLLLRLEREQRALENKLAEIQELRALVVELSEKVRQQEGKRDCTVPKQRDRQPVDPFADPSGSCDEVACVLANYEGACCAKFRSPRRPAASPRSPSTDLPEALDRQSISNGIAAVKARAAACADRSPATGQVKVRVHVGANGRVTSVAVEITPDAALGSCVMAAVERAVFPRTQNGGVFSYPFVF